MVKVSFDDVMNMLLVSDNMRATCMPRLRLLGRRGRPRKRSRRHSRYDLSS